MSSVPLSAAADLIGRVVLVTGAARGQGEAIARRLVAGGAAVLLTDMLDEQGSEVAASLGDAAAYRHLDVRDQNDWETAISDALRRFGALNGLVNNAGILRFGPLEETTLEQYNSVIAVDQIGVFLGMRSVFPALRAAGGGTIVNTSSTSGLRGLPGLVGYAAAKFAVRGMTRVAAIEWGKYNVRVNCVLPGPIDTPMSSPQHTTGWAAQSAGHYDYVPLGRIGRPSEIGEVVAFLTSDASSFCTGAELLVDGGELAGPVKRV
jgi:3alpha(or 20beta)-hydroxysteroid dehydrogenase